MYEQKLTWKKRWFRIAIQFSIDLNNRYRALQRTLFFVLSRLSCKIHFFEIWTFCYFSGGDFMRQMWEETLWGRANELKSYQDVSLHHIDSNDDMTADTRLFIVQRQQAKVIRRWTSIETSMIKLDQNTFTRNNKLKPGNKVCN